MGTLRIGQFKPFFDPRGPIVAQPLLDAVNGRTHWREMFENQGCGVFGHGRSPWSRRRCAMIEDIAMTFKHAPVPRITSSGLEATPN